MSKSMIRRMRIQANRGKPILMTEGVTRVKNLTTGEIGVVQDKLSTQFTVWYDRSEYTEFFFYKTRRIDWEFV